MRPLEWLFVLSFIPVLLMPVIPQRWRHNWLIVSAVLPTVMGILHLIVEGWRIQMIPLYIIALVILVSRTAIVLRGESRVKRTRGIVISILSAMIIIGCVIGAGWLLPVITLPKPTGPYAVGIIDRELVDEERGRKLMVSIWYPAAERGEAAPLTHYPDEVANGIGNLFGLPGIGLQHMRYFMVDASENAPVAINNMPFPILVFSHGMVGLRMQNSPTLQDLASWGYVVVAIDHTDAAAVTVFPNGEARYYDLAKFSISSNDEPDKVSMDEHVMPVWIADQRFVYDTLEKWQQGDPVFSGKLDLTRIGSFGHSFGGATAVEVCRIDTRCGAAVDMDGGLYGEAASKPAVRPLMLMSSTDSNQYPEPIAEWSKMIEIAGADAYWLELPNSGHLSFTITPLLSPILVPDGFDPQVGLRTVDKYLRAFFDKYLRGKETTLLGSESGQTDVRWIQ